VADEHDAAPDGLGRCGRKRIDAVEADHLGGDPGRRRGAAGAERGEDEALRVGRDDLRRLPTAHPALHPSVLDMDVAEAKAPEPAYRPIARRGLPVGAGEAGADLGRQPLGDVVRHLVVRQSGIAQPFRVAGGRRGGKEGGEEGKGSGTDRLGHGEAHASKPATQQGGELLSPAGYEEAGKRAMASIANPVGPQPQRRWLRAFAERRWVVPALFALALGLRLLLILLLPQQPASDGAFYFSRAVGLANGHGYSESGLPTAFWPVGYPALLAATMLLFGPSLLGPMLLNLVASAAILGLILWFGRRVAGGELAARFAGLLYALYPAHIAYTGAVMSETSYTALAMAAFALLVARPRDARWLLLSGLLFGAATLVRPQTLLFPGGALVALLIVSRDFRWRDAAKAVLIVHLALAAIVLPWSLRNERVLGAFVLVSTNGGVSLLTGANDEATGDHFEWADGPLWHASGIPYDQRIARQVELDHRFKGMAADWIRAHPGRWAGLGVKKMAMLWRKDSDGFWMLEYSYPAAGGALTAAQWANQLYYLALLLLAACCFAAAVRAVFRTRDEAETRLGLLLCMPLFATLLAFAFTGQVRYHFPAMPFVIVAAGWTLSRIAGGGLRSAMPRTR
jgi:4-amino-4-deoxy-L-arabinose transferase-like glycosyltransferase